MPKKISGALIASLMAAAGAAAQEAPAGLDCRFDKGTQRSSADRAARRADGELSLSFRSIDTAQGSAELATAASSKPVAAMASGRVLTFVEMRPGGGVAMTTVSMIGGEDTRPAVYSEHLFDSLAPAYLATQRYGACVDQD